MKEKIIEMICERLSKDQQILREGFLSSSRYVGTRFLVIDNLLPESLAMDIYKSFPRKGEMRFFSSFREQKYTFKQLNNAPPILEDITYAIQDPKVIALIEQITEFPSQMPDPSLYAGGLSLMAKDSFLNPHIDNSHDADRNYYRTLNLLYYVTPDWKTEYGGNLELWDKKIKNAKIISSLFNRLVVMETNLSSWHSVNPVLIDSNRCCVSNYYFSDRSPEGHEYFNVTSFSASPDQKVLRVFSKVDSFLRNTVRLFFNTGITKRDIYPPKK